MAIDELFGGRNLLARELPKSSGVYSIFHGSRLLYIGESKNLYCRAITHVSIVNTQRCINCHRSRPIGFPASELRFRFFIEHEKIVRQQKEFELISIFRPQFNCLIAGHRTFKGRIE